MNQNNQFLTNLKSKGKSLSSLRSYKSDIKQFQEWISENNYDLSFTAYDNYKNYLKQNYLKSTVKRKLSSVSQYLEFSIGKEVKQKAGSKFKTYQRNFLFIASYTVFILLLISAVPSQKPPAVADKLVVDKNTPTETINNNIDKSNIKDIKIALSAPETSNINATEYELNSLTNSTDQLVRYSGTGIISAGQETANVYSDKIKADSAVVVTPTSNTKGEVLYIVDQADGYFTVGIENPIQNDINFNWLIANTESYKLSY